MSFEKPSRKDKNQNIQVFVRLRPINQRERDIKSLGVIDVVQNREVVVRHSNQTQHTKKFTFDRAFGPNARQVEVYQEVVSPLIAEVLAGYNCTVFAYGQTGTGKTHTMVGENTTSEDTDWQNDPLAGIIPRALSQLFDELRISNTEYNVRVSYLELYNEELFDLLSTSEDNSKLRIYEDVTRKGANIVNGLEEITVYNRNEVYKIMAQGQERKKVASTLMNAQSSRSHTVFTIVVHMKENSPEGEELVKIGKLNLVDLAGSENISKAGSDVPTKRERARECVNINQSLLTLGRVITALVERHPHIPYRESKLTRILQESLGGRTKTSIIATISPGHKDLEETLSTLEYAHRAKNIQNKPEINQKLTKKAILKEFAEEIDRLKRDLQAARDKNGVYLTEEDFNELSLKQEEQKKEIQELLLKKKAMEEERDKMENIFTELNQTLERRLAELKATKIKLNSTKTELANTNNVLKTTKQQYEEQAHIVEKQVATETTLGTQARLLLATADVATQHVACLHDTVDKRRAVESTNLEVTRSYLQESSQHRENMNATAQNFTHALADDLNKLRTSLDSFATSNSETLHECKRKLEELVQKILESTNEIKSLSSKSESKLAAVTSDHLKEVKSSVDSHQTDVQSALAALVQDVAACVHSAQSQDVTGTVHNHVQQWYKGASARVSSLRRVHAAFASRMTDSEQKRGDTARRHRDARRARVERRNGIVKDTIHEIEEEKARLENRLSEKVSEMDIMRRETEDRLQLWVEEEKRRIQAHVDSERAALEDRLSKKLAEIESEREYLTTFFSRQVEIQEKLLQEESEELQYTEVELSEVEKVGEDATVVGNSFGREFDEDASAISIDMEVFSSNIVQVVQHIYSELLQLLNLAHQNIEKDANTLIEKDTATNKQFVERSESSIAQLLHANRDVMESVIDKVEANNISTMLALGSLSSTATAIITATATASSDHSAAVSGVKSRVQQYEANLRELVAKQDNAVGRWLTEEYKMYSPTGKTPGRTRYSYPRALAATSPHERILARFRALRTQHDDDEDCLVVESEGDSRSDSSEDSALQSDNAFLEPSPPAPRPTPRGNEGRSHGIVKCTSETDIYAIRRSQENHKENSDRSLSYSKKPSKLPAPASHKKPLAERN